MHKFIKILGFIAATLLVVFFISAIKIVVFGDVNDAITVFESSANLIQKLIDSFTLM